MSICGLIFSNIHDDSLPELTRFRAISSVPFGCRYRLIDFPLSNMVNSDISNIGIVTRENYKSLMEHISSGKDWDLARNSGGIHILPPLFENYSRRGNNSGYIESRLEALKSISDYINKLSEEYVIISDSDMVCNINLTDMLKSHEKRGSDVTFASKKSHINRGKNPHTVVFAVDENKRITDTVVNPTDLYGDFYTNLNIVLMKTALLKRFVSDALAHGYTSFTLDIVLKNINKLVFSIYDYHGYYRRISSLKDYFDTNMELLSSRKRRELFDHENRTIYTKIRNSPPTRYTDNCKVINSLVADGCIIDGIVENSIIFRGVKIEKGSVIKNSIIMKGTSIGENSYLNCMICDKNVYISNDCSLSGHFSLPLYLSKGTRV